MRPPPQHPVEGLTPTWSFSDESTGEHSLQLGFRCKFAVSGWIVGAAWLQSPGDDRAHWALLKTGDFDIQRVFAWPGELTGSFEGAWVWVRRRLSPAWFVESDVVYQFMVGYCHVAYAYSHNVLDTEVTSGDLILLANNYDGSRSSGIFKYGEPFSPDIDRGEGTLYGVDLMFQPK